MPAMTVLFRACPEGKENAYSYGGIASLRGGLALPRMALPTLVITNEPAAAMAINTSGVRDRHRHTMSAVVSDAMMVMPIKPPSWVKPVMIMVLVAVRSLMA